MDRVSGRLIVYFEDSFWVGVFERVIDKKLSAAKVTFGAEPKDIELLEFTSSHKNKYEFPIGIGITEEVTVNDACTGCGTCSRLCPMGNIHIENGRPLFSKSCISCGACIQNCPNNAIHHNREKSSARYRNPHIEIGELLIS